MWSFDRVVAGSAYTGSTVEPVLHRYNDAKYVCGDAAARTWLRGLVLAHGGASGTEGTGGAGGPGGLGPAPAPVFDLEAVEGADAKLPIVVD